MKLSRERKVYVAILALGGCVLGADRFMGGPSSATASTTKVAAASSESGDGSAAPAQARRVALHEHLAQLAVPLDPSSAGKSFQIDRAWYAELSPVDASVATSARSSDSAGREFKAPRVTMVVQDASGGFAVLDGKVLRIGERTPGGLMLVGIANGIVTVESEGIEYTIPVADGSATSVR